MRALLLVVGICLSMFAGEIKILAAANLKLVLEEVKTEFLKDYPNDSVQITYLASGKAYAQIKNGLEVDLFFSADTQKPDALFAEKFALFTPQIYALGKLVLCTTSDINISTIEALKSSKVKHISIANPKLAPYGKAAVEFLESSKLYDSVSSKIVMGDSIGQALSQVKSGGAEVGINALSLVIGDPNFSYKAIDPKYYNPIKQSFVILKQTKNENLARAFARFVMSATGRSLFEKYGYDVP